MGVVKIKKLQHFTEAFLLTEMLRNVAHLPFYGVWHGL